MISNTKSNLRLLFLSCIFLGSLLVATFSFGQTAYAAEPGCYEETSPGVWALLDITECPTESVARAVSDFDACFVGIEERDCDDLSLPGASVPVPGSISGPSTSSAGSGDVAFAVNEGQYQCGTGDNAVKTGLNLGCKGRELESVGQEINPVIDMLFALFRVAAAGVGLVLIGSIIYAGIQYTASRGNPQTTEAAIKRVASALEALVIYIFIFAIANFLIPGGLLL